MISNEISFHAPRAVEEALALLAEQGDDVTVLAGGMSLVPMMNLGLAKPDIVMSLNHVSGLDHVRRDDRSVIIGACARHAHVHRNDVVRRHCPALSEAAALVGDVQVRNRGTIGGSVAHADPAADYLPVLAALGGAVRLRSAASERLVDPDDFFIDLMFTAREPSELVTEIVLPVLPDGWGSSYKRLARVEGSFAIVNAAAVVAPDLSTARIALGGVGPRPALIDVAGELRDGLTDGALEQVEEHAYEASADATGDVMSDAEYRRAMARVFARRALVEAVGRSAHVSSHD